MDEDEDYSPYKHQDISDQEIPRPRERYCFYHHFNDGAHACYQTFNLTYTISRSGNIKCAVISVKIYP